MAYAFLVVAGIAVIAGILLAYLLHRFMVGLNQWLELFYELEANRKPIKVNVVMKDKDTPDPASYPALGNPGVYNPEEEDMVGWLKQYGEFHPIATSNPYRGWTVFDDPEG